MELSIHVLVGMGVPEEAVVAPGEGPAAPVKEVVGGGLGELASVLVPEVLEVSGVLNLGVVDPCDADGNARDTDEVADLPPEVSGLGSVVLEGLLLGKVGLESSGLLGGETTSTTRSSACGGADGVPDGERHD